MDGKLSFRTTKEKQQRFRKLCLEKGLSMNTVLDDLLGLVLEEKIVIEKNIKINSANHISA